MRIEPSQPPRSRRPRGRAGASWTCRLALAALLALAACGGGGAGDGSADAGAGSADAGAGSADAGAGSADAGAAGAPAEADRVAPVQPDAAAVAAAIGTTSVERVRVPAPGELAVTLYVSTDGDDAAAGTSPDAPLRTVGEAWNRVPQGSALSGGVRIQLAAGSYDAADLPNYWEHRHGTEAAPIVVAGEAADRAAVVLRGGLNVFDTSWFHLIDLTVRPEPAGDAFHCEQCDHLVLRNVVLDGGSAEEGAQETLKVNQSTNVFVEDSDIGGATDNAVDFVAVQGGHLLGNVVHDAQDWCGYAKGGSAYLWVEGNTFTRCGTGGFTAGQGTGFEFMTAPWLTYEAMGIVVYRNAVIGTEGAGLGVNGGYNVLLAHNTLYRVGTRSHAIEVVGGARSCDGDRAACGARLEAGGWGATDEGGQWIPNDHVWVLNNLVVNPAGHTSPYGQVAVAGALDAPASSNVAASARADGDLHIAGNVFDNGASLPWIDGEGCRGGACTAEAVAAANLVAAVQLADPDAGDVRAERVAGWVAAPMPRFAWDDAPLGAPAWAVDMPEAGTGPGLG